LTALHGVCSAQRAEIPSCPAQLYVWADADGAVSLGLDLPLSPVWGSEARKTIETVLGTETDNFSKSDNQCDPGWTCFYMDLGTVLSRKGFLLRGDLPLAGLRALLQASNYREVDIYLELPDTPHATVNLDGAEFVRES